MPPEAATIEDPDTLVVLDNDADDPNAPVDGAEGEGEGDAQSNPEAERVAALMGWKPIDQWKGDKTNWRPAEEFLAEVPQLLRKARETTTKQRSQLDRIVAEVAKLSANQRRDMDARQERELEQAIEAGDTEAARKILNEVRTSQGNDEPPAVAEFKTRNAEWFEVDPEATAYAAMLDQMYARQAPNGISDHAAHMKRIEDGVKKKFPELFGEGNEEQPEPKTQKARAPLVASGNRVSGRNDNGLMTVSNMTPQQRAAAKELGISEASYAKSFNELKAKGRL